MVRADRNYPSLYFGRPGSLVTLPWPRDGIDRPYDRLTFDFPTGSGQHIVSKLAAGSRPYTLSWAALHVDNYRLLEQYAVGAMGQGPWAVIDPAMTNLLLPNQAACTNLYNGPYGFTATSGLLFSNALSAWIHRTGATRSLRWNWSSAPGATTPTLSLSVAYRSWYGVPVVPGLSYAFSSWMKPDGVIDTDITVAMKLSWVGPTGSALSSATSGAIATGNAWKAYSVIGVAPAGAAYVKPTWEVTGTTVAAGGSLYVDEVMLEQDTVVNSWAPGTGVRPVEILELNDTVPFNSRFRAPVSMSLRELVV